ncbi:MutS-related protein [Sediminitomix flava]|uniref:MutS-like protein n=1 Tax=Sediminitomix flava TaxID=379075 RepID=A0A315ZDQ0_SEDFL|nr:DNA mismatch repair protein MutS [Sediminitomix flava]PWJ43270.1 MutS-like protein [Sediminitomix flava]
MGKTKERTRLKDSFGRLKDESFYFNDITQFFNRKDKSNAFHVISEEVCSDLDFEELFMFLDRTNSKVGQQYLYHKLRTIPQGDHALSYKERLINIFTEDEEFRIETQLELSKLNKRGAYSLADLFQSEFVQAPKWFSIFPMLSFIGVTSLLFSFAQPNLFIIFLATFSINSIIHYWNKKTVYNYIGAIPHFFSLCLVAKRLYKKDVFKQLNPKLEGAIQEMNQIRRKMVFFRLESSMQGEYGIILWWLIELLKIGFLLEPIFLFSVLRRLEHQRKECEEVFSFVGEIDCLLSVASLRSGLSSYSFPSLNASRVSAEQVYHPLIPNCVTNSIDLVDKSILLTGSNMSGKTSFIRTIGVSVLTGLTINTCFAKSMIFPRLRLHSAIRISDDLMNNKSYYFEEVLRIKEILDASHDSSNLFLLDEIFKGTNTIERIATGKAVLSKLASPNNFVFVATHDIELTELLANDYEQYHFSEAVSENTIDFDYKLKQGKLKNRNAIRILQVNDYPSDLIQEAYAIVEELDVHYGVSR